MEPLRPSLLLALLAASVLCGCDRPRALGEPEEVQVTESDVPPTVRATAQRVCELLEGAAPGRWAWDEENQEWEVEVLGLGRTAQLDILPDGRFSELELVHTPAEVEAALPEVAVLIYQRCHDHDARIELSLRSEQHLVALPDLQLAWTLDAVAIEFQCKSRRDFEIVPGHLLQEDRMDDVEGAER